MKRRESADKTKENSWKSLISLFTLCKQSVCVWCVSQKSGVSPKNHCEDLKEMNTHFKCMKCKWWVLREIWRGSYQSELARRTPWILLNPFLIQPLLAFPRESAFLICFHRHHGCWFMDHILNTEVLNRVCTPMSGFWTNSCEATQRSIRILSTLLRKFCWNKCFLRHDILSLMRLCIRKSRVQIDF